MLRIRKAVVADAKSINALCMSLGYELVTDIVAKQRLEQLIASDLDMIYVAQLDNQVVGWIHCLYARRLASASFYEIAGLVVSSSVRNQGIGKELVGFAMQQSESAEVWRVRCHEQRDSAHKFYQSIDFKIKKKQFVFSKKLHD